jgi:hypothetical protein
MIHLSSIHHYTAPLATLAPLLLATVHFALFTPANLEHPHLSFSLRTISFSLRTPLSLFLITHNPCCLCPVLLRRNSRRTRCVAQSAMRAGKRGLIKTTTRKLGARNARHRPRQAPTHAKPDRITTSSLRTLFSPEWGLSVRVAEKMQRRPVKGIYKDT